MVYLLIFISGIIFATILLPILDAFGSWLQNIFGAKSVGLQVKTEKMKAEVDQTPVHSIGFQYEAPVEDDDEDWEEEEDE